MADETIAEGHARLLAAKHAQWEARHEVCDNWIEAIVFNPGSVIFPLDPIEVTN